MMKNKQGLQTITLFDMETVSVKGFCAFLRNNIPLVIAVTAALFFTYGSKLFWYSIGIDTELFMADKSGVLLGQIQIGRFGLSLLSRLWYIKEFNPWTAFFTAFCLVWFWTLSWCYIIAIFGKNTGRNNNLIPFALLAMTHAVWAEMFYFTFMAAQTALVIALCPYTVYFLYKGFLDGEKGKVIAAFILLIFMTSVYQAVVPLFCLGVFACFILLQEHSDYEPKTYRLLCLKLFITLAAAMAVYSFIDRIIIPFGFHIEKSEYLDSMNRWGERSIKENVRAVLIFCYTITAGNIPFVQDLVYQAVARYARTGIRAAEEASWIFKDPKETGNVLLIPAMVFFLAMVMRKARSLFPRTTGKRGVLYILAALGIPVSFMLLTLLGGSAPPVRSLWALPFAFAFIVLYLIENSSRKCAVVITVIALCAALHQGEITAQLLYSDYMRYNEDVRVARELNMLILGARDESENIPVAFTGRYKIAPHFKNNFIEGEVTGHSFFDWDTNMTPRGLAFMRSLGMVFKMADEKLREKAEQEARSMPSYPAPGCVKRLPDVIVVKLPDAYPPGLE